MHITPTLLNLQRFRKQNLGNISKTTNDHFIEVLNNRIPEYEVMGNKDLFQR